MPKSSCPKCGKETFELVEHTPKKSNYKVHFIQCEGCGAVVGVLPFFNANQQINNLEQKIGKLHNDILFIKSKLN